MDAAVRVRLVSERGRRAPAATQFILVSGGTPAASCEGLVWLIFKRERFEGIYFISIVVWNYSSQSPPILFNPPIQTKHGLKQLVSVSLGGIATWPHAVRSSILAG